MKPSPSTTGPTPTPTPSALSTFSSLPISAPVGPNIFSIIQITDTQYLSVYYPDAFTNLTSWIVQNAAAYNLKMVIHTGDFVDYAISTDQWENANDAMSILLKNNIPYCWDAGNHDQIPFNDPNGTWFGSQYPAFDEQQMRQKSYWVSDILNGKNTATKFAYDSHSFLIINMEYEANPTVIRWMKNLIESNPNSNVIIAAHDFLNAEGYLTTDEWSDPLKETLDNYPNVFLTLNGHNFGGEHNYTSLHIHDGNRTEVFFNMQEEHRLAPNAPIGAAVARIYEFNMSNNTVTALTYQVWNNEWLTDDLNQYTFSFNPK